MTNKRKPVLLILWTIIIQSTRQSLASLSNPYSPSHSFSHNPYAYQTASDPYANQQIAVGSNPYGSASGYSYPVIDYGGLTINSHPNGYLKEGNYDEYSYDDDDDGHYDESHIQDSGYDSEEASDYDEYPMSNAARMLMYGHNPYMMAGYGYNQQQPVHHNPYGYHDMDMKKKKKKKKKKKHKGYDMDHYHDDDDDHYDHDDDHDHYDDHDDHYPKKKKKKHYKPKKKKKIKKVYVPIVIKKKKKKKRKTIAVYKGFYIPGGLQIFGKFKKVKDCKKACEITPNCFAADYNPWLKKCYIHTNVTACNNMRTHPKLIHFKKVPCDLLETPRGLIILGVRVHGGLEQKGIKNLQDCIKKCATAGQGIAPNTMPEEKMKQICFGIDYDFATHKCYFHTDMDLCPDVDPIPTPPQTVEAPSNILILLCPRVVV